MRGNIVAIYNVFPSKIDKDNFEKNHNKKKTM
jgi:hypothetical protein